MDQGYYFWCDSLKWSLTFKMAFFYQPEPLHRSDKKKRTEFDMTLQPRQMIAAIDFGTTFVSLAYITSGDDKVNTLKLDSTFERVPNAILLKRVPGNKCVVEDFGFKAQASYCKIRTSEQQNYIYFGKIKMLLERDEVSTVSLLALQYLAIHHKICL